MNIKVNRPSPLHTNVRAARVQDVPDGSVRWAFDDKANNYVMLAPGDNEVDDRVGKAIADSSVFKTWAKQTADDGRPWVEVTKR